jgi:photosystem II stability/assembly factor-like uncharacterized protein
MKTTSGLLRSCGLLAISLCASPIVMAEPEIDIQYAETMPLAKHSLLLDITRADNVLVAVGERGHVLRSVDNGANWVQAEHVPTRSTLTTVFSIGERIWAGGHDAVIITSGDDGITWTLQNYDPERQQAVMDVLFTDADNGMAIGSYGLYLRTQDGGQTWEDENVDPDNEFHLNSMVLVGESPMMIAGEAGYSYRSEDAGDSWEALELPYEGSMWGAIRTAANCVVFYGLRGHALESCDFGDSWTQLDTGTMSSIAGAAFSGDVLLLAANSGTVLTRAADGPIESYQHSSGGDFAAAIGNQSGGFLLVGEDGVHHFPETDLTGGNDD